MNVCWQKNSYFKKKPKSLKKLIKLILVYKITNYFMIQNSVIL